jgi:hypothetical protein
MRNMLTILALLATITFANAQGYHYVRPYTRSNGTYVPHHYQTNPDRSFQNNWSTYPNINPFTGRQGTIRTMPRSRSFYNGLRGW